MSNNIIWLASYPKSGNTWCRALISNLRHETAANINQLHTDGIASARDCFESSTLTNSAHLSYDEIDIIRPALYNHQSDLSTKPLFVKVHDAYTFNLEQNPIFPAYASKVVVYIVRNPLDVAVSYAAHTNVPIDKSIELLNDSSHCIAANRNGVSNQFRQKLLNWSEHASSWLSQSEIPVLLIRYEDLHTSPMQTITELAKFCGLAHDKNSISKSIQQADFKKLQEQEQQEGFSEKPQKMASFFRKGVVGSWQEELTPAQIQLVIERHRPTMERLGYLAQ